MCSSIANADIFKYVSKDGSVYYTDKPHKGLNYKRILVTKKKSKSKPWHAAYKNLAKNKAKYTPLIAAAAEKYAVDENLLHAIIRTESAYDVNAESVVGAVGLMQLMPATAARYGVVDRNNAAQNIDGGTQYIKFLLKLFKSDIRLAIAAYNAGEGAVKKYNYTIPPYRETIRYVQKVLKQYGSS